MANGLMAFLPSLQPCVGILCMWASCTSFALFIVVEVHDRCWNAPVPVGRRRRLVWCDRCARSLSHRYRADR